MIPRPEEIKTIDHLVDRLDFEQIHEPLIGRATRSFAAIWREWERFKAHVDLLDEAVRAPLAPGAAAILLTAGGLVNHAAHALAFALGHVGEAIARHDG
jgi:hypothetical protein